MLSAIKERRNRDDEGFTLIELMVVVLIIAILLAIAIPTFLGARNQANSRAVQSTLRNALTAEQTYFTNNQSFGTTTSTPTINSIEPNIQWNTTVSATNPNQVLVSLMSSSTGTDDEVALQALGKDGNCYTVFQNNSSGASGTTTAYEVDASTSGACTAPAAATSVSTGSAVKGGGYYSSW